MTDNSSIQKWLEACPVPVVNNAYPCVDTIRSLAISSCLYEKGTLVVVELSTLGELYTSMKNRARDSNQKLLFMLQKSLDMIHEQSLHIEAPLLPEGEALLSEIEIILKNNPLQRG